MIAISTYDRRLRWSAFYLLPDREGSPSGSTRIGHRFSLCSRRYRGPLAARTFALFLSFRAPSSSSSVEDRYCQRRNVFSRTLLSSDVSVFRVFYGDFYFVFETSDKAAGCRVGRGRIYLSAALQTTRAFKEELDVRNASVRASTNGPEIETERSRRFASRTYTKYSPTDIRIIHVILIGSIDTNVRPILRTGPLNSYAAPRRVRNTRTILKIQPLKIPMEKCHGDRSIKPRRSDRRTSRKRERQGRHRNDLREQGTYRAA